MSLVMKRQPMIPAGDPPDHRAYQDPETGVWTPGPGSDAKSWHVGCMVTQRRAVIAAKVLFPEDYHDGKGCGPGDGPSQITLELFDVFDARVTQVRRAMMEAFR